MTKRVVISGGTSGIGLALARGYADAGWSVIAAGLQSADCQSQQDRIQFVELDVTDDSSVQSLISGQDRLDAIVNAAGTIARHDEFQLDTFQRVVDVNLMGTMRLATGARTKLAAHGGSIVNIASMLSFFGGGVVPAYASSKGGVVQLTKSLAIAWAHDGIRVNAIAPGWIETPMTEALRADVTRNDAIIQRTPMARWGRPEEIVGPALFLTSEAASFITGAVLTVDGGYSVT